MGVTEMLCPHWDLLERRQRRHWMVDKGGSAGLSEWQMGPASAGECRTHVGGLAMTVYTVWRTFTMQSEHTTSTQLHTDFVPSMKPSMQRCSARHISTAGFAPTVTRANVTGQSVTHAPSANKALPATHRWQDACVLLSRMHRSQSTGH